MNRETWRVVLILVVIYRPSQPAVCRPLVETKGIAGDGWNVYRYIFYTFMFNYIRACFLKHKKHEHEQKREMK